MTRLDCLQYFDIKRPMGSLLNMSFLDIITANPRQDAQGTVSKLLLYTK